MERNNKSNLDIKLFRKVLIEKDYNDFLEIIAGKEEEIANIDVSPITNFGHSATDKNEDLLIELYQHIKYYLENKNLYSSKMQEGMALCASKAIIMSEFYPTSIENYLSVGDRCRKARGNNPFEEICRVLLIALKDEKYLERTEEENIMFGPIENKGFESKLFFNVIMKALNGEKLVRTASIIYTKDIITEISDDLENSNITSTAPISATKKENRELLISQFDRIENLYANKMDRCTLLGIIPNNLHANKLTNRFNNKIVLAKRNIGVYEQTKRLIK